MKAFFTIHDGLSREGPGDRASLDRALAVAVPGPDGVICDAGCGPGADIEGLLAHVPRGRVHAVDLHSPFVERVKARFGRDPRVTAEVADFTRLRGRFDLIWSAGAVYDPGLAASLAAFRDALAEGGCIAFSHLCWRDGPRPDAAVAFWAAEFPAMTGLAAAEAVVGAAALRVRDSFWLPPEAWEAYYVPLEARLDALTAGADAEMAEAISAHRDEIAIWRAHGDSYGYRLMVVAP